MTDDVTSFYQDVEARHAVRSIVSPEDFQAWCRCQALYHAILLAKKKRDSDAIMLTRWVEYSARGADPE